MSKGKWFGVVVLVSGIVLNMSPVVAFAGKESVPTCKTVDPLIPSCSEGCMPVRVCVLETGLTDEECKDCLAAEGMEQCIFFNHEIGWCRP